MRRNLAIILGWLMTPMLVPMHAWADVVIGLAVPNTGPVAAIGQQVINGAQAAVAAVNKSGGVLGQPVRLEIADDACDPRQAVSVANHFVSSHVQLIAGHVCSGASIAASDVYAEEGDVMVSPASNAAKLTDRGLPGIFRVCGRDDMQGQVAARIVAQRWGSGRIAILHDNSAFGRGLADATGKALEALGVHPVISDAITPGEKDYNAVITRLKQAGIDLVYYGGYQQEAGLLVRQAKDQGFGGQFFMTSGIATTEFAQIAGPAADGVLFTFNPDARKRPEAAPIVADFKARGIDPQGFTLYGYAAVQVLAQAANDAKSSDPKAVAAALHADSFDTVLGPARFDTKGDITAPGYRLYVWHGGNFDYAEGT